jgi:hypothetical protein
MLAPSRVESQEVQECNSYAAGSVISSGLVRETSSVLCSAVGARNSVEIVTRTEELTTEIAPTHGSVAVAYRLTRLTGS